MIDAIANPPSADGLATQPAPRRYFSSSRPDIQNPVFRFTQRRFWIASELPTIRELPRGWLESNCRVEIESVSVAVLKSRAPDRIMRPLENSGEAEAASRSFRGVGRWA